MRVEIIIFSIVYLLMDTLMLFMCNVFDGKIEFKCMLNKYTCKRLYLAGICLLIVNTLIEITNPRWIAATLVSLTFIYILMLGNWVYLMSIYVNQRRTN